MPKQTTEKMSRRKKSKANRSVDESPRKSIAEESNASSSSSSSLPKVQSAMPPRNSSQESLSRTKKDTPLDKESTRKRKASHSSDMTLRESTAKTRVDPSSKSSSSSLLPNIQSPISKNSPSTIDKNISRKRKGSISSESPPKKSTVQSDVKLSSIAPSSSDSYPKVQTAVPSKNSCQDSHPPDAQKTKKKKKKKKKSSSSKLSPNTSTVELSSSRVSSQILSLMSSKNSSLESLPTKKGPHLGISTTNYSHLSEEERTIVVGFSPSPKKAESTLLAHSSCAPSKKSSTAASPSLPPSSPSTSDCSLLMEVKKDDKMVFINPFHLSSPTPTIQNSSDSVIIIEDSPNPQMSWPRPQVDLSHLPHPQVDLSQLPHPQVDLSQLPHPQVDLSQLPHPQVDLSQLPHPQVDLSQLPHPQVDLSQLPHPQVDLSQLPHPQVDLSQLSHPQVDLPHRPLPPVVLPHPQVDLSHLQMSLPHFQLDPMYTSTPRPSLEPPPVNIFPSPIAKGPEQSPVQSQASLFFETASETIVNRDNIDDNASEEEEDMDWDDAISTLNDARENTLLLQSETVGGLTELVAQKSIEKPQLDAPGKTVLVIDTNVFISALSSVKDVLRHPMAVSGQLFVLLPWVVLQELDYLKQHHKNIRSQSMSAVRFINEQLMYNNPQIISQSPQQATERIIQIESNDDKIIVCCLQRQKANDKDDIILVTRDINLSSKAMVSGIKSADNQTMWKELSPTSQTSAKEIREIARVVPHKRQQPIQSSGHKNQVPQNNVLQDQAPQNSVLQNRVLQKFSYVFGCFASVGQDPSQAAPYIYNLLPYLVNLHKEYDRCLMLSPIHLRDFPTYFDGLRYSLNNIYKPWDTLYPDHTQCVFNEDLIQYFQDVKNRPRLYSGLQQLKEFINNCFTQVQRM